MKKLYNYTYSYIIDKDNRTVTAISEYAGKPVKGIAKCSPEDEFDENVGVKLATARCKTKIAKKQYKTASNKVEKLDSLAHQMNKRLEKMKEEKHGAFIGMCLSLGNEISMTESLK
jgi:hypothetical protein